MIERPKCIKISIEAHDLLSDFGNKGETFDHIIKRIFKQL